MGEGCKLTIDRDLPIETKRRIFGGFLRAAREGCDKSLTELVHATRISPNFVMALESGDFEVLPGRVFGRGFIKNLCTALDIPSQELLDAYNLCWDEESHNSELHSVTSKNYKTSIDYKAYTKSLRMTPKRWAATGTLVALVMGVGLWKQGVLQQGPSSDPKVVDVEQTQGGQSVAPTADEAVVIEPEEVPMVADSQELIQSQVKQSEVLPKEVAIQEKSAKGRLRLQALKETKIFVRVDQEKEQEMEVAAGEERVLRFESSLLIHLMDSQDVDIQFQGRRLGSLGQGERHLSFKANAEAVYAAQAK